MKYLSIINPVDSLTQVQEEIVAVAEKLANTPADVLISDLIDKAVAFGLKVLTALIIYLVGAWLIKKIKGVIGNLLLKRKADATISSFVQSLVTIALTIILIITTVGALGIDTTSIAALLAGGGMAIGMALNGTVQNFAGGIMLLVFRPFKAGDYIQAQGYEGTVTEVTIVNTKLTTVDNKNIVIPNGILSNGTINNFSQNKLRRLSWIVNVEYGCTVEETKELLMSMMKNDERILNMATGAPAEPFVALNELTSSSVQFVMRGWVRTEDYWDVNYDINEKIYTELTKNGIRFPYSKLDVTITQSALCQDLPSPAQD